MARRNRTQTIAPVAPVAIAEITTQVDEVIEQVAEVEQVEVETSKLRSCTCGCGNTGPGRFRPGHDARLHGRVARFRHGRLDLSTLPQGERDAVEAFQGDVPHTTSFAKVGNKPASRTTAQVKVDNALAKVRKLEAALEAAKAEYAAFFPAKAEEVEDEQVA